MMANTSENIIWICPSCESENIVDDSTSWRNKKMKCNGCKVLHHYSEYILKEHGKDNDERI